MRKNVVTIALGAGWILVLTGLVYVTGGTKNAYVHLLYFPVMLAAFRAGAQAGAVTGLIAGLLMMFMPIDVSSGAEQPLASAMVRLIAFSLVGACSGWAVASLRKEQAETQRLLEQSVIALVNTIDSSHRWTSGHSLRVSAIAVLIGERLGLNDSDMYVLRGGSLLHDIGKLSLPNDLLDKNGKLTDEEYELIKTHPVEGDRILQAFNHPRASAIRHIVRHHHERLDGSGYPDGLRGDEISLFARITAIADAYEAMTSVRPYREALTPAEALVRLEQDAALGKVDGDVLRHLRELVNAGLVPDSDTFAMRATRRGA